MKRHESVTNPSQNCNELAPGYIYIKNYDMYQSYRDGRPIIWVKLYTQILEKYNDDGTLKATRALPDGAWRLWVSLILLAGRFRPFGRIPYDLKMIENETGADPQYLYLLLDTKLLRARDEIVTESRTIYKDRYIITTTEKEKETTKEKEKETPEPVEPEPPPPPVEVKPKPKPEPRRRKRKAATRPDYSPEFLRFFSAWCEAFPHRTGYQEESWKAWFKLDYNPHIETILDYLERERVWRKYDYLRRYGKEAEPAEMYSFMPNPQRWLANRNFFDLSTRYDPEEAKKRWEDGETKKRGRTIGPNGKKYGHKDLTLDTGV